MAPAQTCSACRGRKVRCDGVVPMCGPCSKARKPIECVYTATTAVSTAPKGEYLKKGAACAPCRRKKKKCDATRPCCSTCKVAGKEKDCTYDESVEQTIAEALLLRTHLLEQRLAAYESQVGALGNHPHSDEGRLEQAVASSSRLAIPSHPVLGSHDLPLFDFPQALNTLFDRLSAPPPTADVHHLSVPHESIRLSEFRSTWAIHAPQYGCVLSDEKMHASLAGDLTGLIVHPAFTYIAQLLGCLMWQIQRQAFVFPQVEYEQLQLLLLALEDIDPISEIQARYLLAIYYLLKKQMQDGEAQLTMAIDIVHRHNLTFPVMPDTFDPIQMQEVSPQQAELIGALAHLIYLDRDSSIVFRVPPRLDTTLDDALTNVALYYPVLAKTNLAYLRARSLLLFLRARELAAEWKQMDSLMDLFCPPRGAWFEQYWPLLEEISTHATTIEGEMLKTTFYGDRERSVALKFCLVIALTGKAQLHWLPHKDHEESAQRTLDVVLEIVNISRTFKDNDFLLLDPLLGVCWATVARIVAEAVKGRFTPLPTGVSWNAALQTIDTSVKKLGFEIPFTEDSVREISDVVRVVDAS
ncbi:hypothetical protein BD309DRAFT_944502 [Dichomitus squalens]|uniref:Zn(2)-C6 fungal-type domain-containing protein n=1 Tax=Dichomitus squalens TaxID=114155 RepID=A0A4Q9QDP9_9APHY|nr:uncharacterized protein DICSQDRAFT_132003 [Dichomitus squalens LYAD-421 SS1]EJF65793.1 hypothetical protein DICSQDRAFT_132003 [Dichomitus squalens LYAD-421 SS1]TBU32423.1 hypothetical protein BD311DRAFT_715086 [Dichomitus squalens]TBU50699.1 hypothetical protein BD309DRAFT_944502 [Dichomitus squalens]TBU65907.1 hypothetical protein BD310DRAFT_912335 [Dichomitus squalens]